MIRTVACLLLLQVLTVSAVEWDFTYTGIHTDDACATAPSSLSRNPACRLNDGSTTKSHRVYCIDEGFPVIDYFDSPTCMDGTGTTFGSPYPACRFDRLVSSDPIWWHRSTSCATDSDDVCGSFAASASVVSYRASRGGGCKFDDDSLTDAVVAVDGQCIPIVEGSYKMMCTGDGNVDRLEYASADCSGNATSAQTGVPTDVCIEHGDGPMTTSLMYSCSCDAFDGVMPPPPTPTVPTLLDDWVYTEVVSSSDDCSNPDSTIVFSQKQILFSGVLVQSGCAVPPGSPAGTAPSPVTVAYAPVATDPTVTWMSPSCAPVVSGSAMFKGEMCMPVAGMNDLCSSGRDYVGAAVFEVGSCPTTASDKLASGVRATVHDMCIDDSEEVDGMVTRKSFRAIRVAGGVSLEEFNSPDCTGTATPTMITPTSCAKPPGSDSPLEYNLAALDTLGEICGMPTLVAGATGGFDVSGESGPPTPPASYFTYSTTHTDDVCGSTPASITRTPSGCHGTGDEGPTGSAKTYCNDAGEVVTDLFDSPSCMLGTESSTGLPFPACLDEGSGSSFMATSCATDSDDVCGSFAASASVVSYRASSGAGCKMDDDSLMVAAVAVDGQCTPNREGSYKMMCSADGNVDRFEYATADCSGDATSSDTGIPTDMCIEYTEGDEPMTMSMMYSCSCDAFDGAMPTPVPVPTLVDDWVFTEVVSSSDDCSNPDSTVVFSQKPISMSGVDVQFGCAVPPGAPAGTPPSPVRLAHMPTSAEPMVQWTSPSCAPVVPGSAMFKGEMCMPVAGMNDLCSSGRDYVGGAIYEADDCPITVSDKLASAVRAVVHDMCIDDSEEEDGTVMPKSFRTIRVAGGLSLEEFDTPDCTGVATPTMLTPTSCAKPPGSDSPLVYNSVALDTLGEMCGMPTLVAGAMGGFDVSGGSGPPTPPSGDCADAIMSIRYHPGMRKFVTADASLGTGTPIAALSTAGVDVFEVHADLAAKLDAPAWTSDCLRA